MANLKAPCSISKTTKFSSSDNPTCKTEDIPTQGRISEDGTYAWITQGPELSVYRLSNGYKIASWRFGYENHIELGGEEPNIICVTELPSIDVKSQVPQLLVGLSYGVSQGMLCVFDLVSSQVVDAIKFPQKVKSLSLVDAGSCESQILPHISDMCGVVAVGLGAGGRILLLDLCRRQQSFRTEQQAVEPVIVASIPGDHTFILLNETSFRLDKYLIRSSDGKVKCKFPLQKVEPLSLRYVPCIASLIVGFNFGAFEIWNLRDQTLLFTSPLNDQMVPITHIAFQEPSDDPRNFCYIWVVHSEDTINDSSNNSSPIAFMYALCFQWKEWIDNYGYLYKTFKGCSRHFECELRSSSNDQILGGSSISCQTIGMNTHFRQRSVCPDDFDDSSYDNDLSLCLFAWETWNCSRTYTHLALFDLNQWYKEEMPNTGRSTYMAVFDLDAPLAGKTQKLLDVKIDENSLQPYRCDTNQEEHYHPSALAFVSQILFKTELLELNHPGEQRFVLSYLDQNGPLAVMHPTKLFEHCIQIGLKPLLFELDSLSGEITLDEQRQFLLTLALEWQMSGFLYQCAVEWAGGAQSVAGCSLHMLLSWGWEWAVALKEEATKICYPLFDHSGTKLDRNTRRLLSTYRNQLSHLAGLFRGVLNSTKISKFHFSSCVDQQCKALEMVALYFEVVQWFMNAGLLPEFPDCNSLDGKISLENQSFHKLLPYPASTLESVYAERRSELGNDLKLFIDLLLEEESTGKLVELWKADGGSGQYPPPSLQSLLNTYLLDELDTSAKHRIVIYVFLDLAALYDDRFAGAINYLIKFPAAFYMRPSIIKITQAMWLLDHKDFEEALHMVLDPMISLTDMDQWQHRAIVRTFLQQGHSPLALDYMVCKRMPLETSEDVRLKVSILLENQRLLEAYECQHAYSTDENSRELLEHFLSECQRTKQLKQVMDILLTPFEEKQFMNFLSNARSEYADNMRVMYYLQQSRVLEALEVNNFMEMKNKTRSFQDQKSLRSQYVRCRAKGLPEITQRLAEFCAKSGKILNHYADSPQPLSMEVNRNISQHRIFSRSSTIQIMLEKTRETWYPDAKIVETNTLTQDIPFLFTPYGINVKSKKSPVIFPTERKRRLIGFEKTPAKRQRLGDYSPLNNVSVNKDKENTMDEIDTSVLLNTPHVKRVSELRFSARNSPSETPVRDTYTLQSILKVRTLIRRSNTPEESSMKSAAVCPEDIGANMEVEVYANQSSNVTDNNTEETTGRQIRFSLPRQIPVLNTDSQSSSPKSSCRNFDQKETPDHLEEDVKYAEDIGRNIKSPHPSRFFCTARKSPNGEFPSDKIAEESTFASSTPFRRKSLHSFKLNKSIVSKELNKYHSSLQQNFTSDNLNEKILVGKEDKCINYDVYSPNKFTKDIEFEVSPITESEPRVSIMSRKTLSSNKVIDTKEHNITNRDLENKTTNTNKKVLTFFPSITGHCSSEESVSFESCTSSQNEWDKVNISDMENLECSVTHDASTTHDTNLVEFGANCKATSINLELNNFEYKSGNGKKSLKTNVISDKSSLTESFLSDSNTYGFDLHSDLKSENLSPYSSVNYKVENTSSSYKLTKSLKRTKAPVLKDSSSILEEEESMIESKNEIIILDEPLDASNEYLHTSHKINPTIKLERENFECNQGSNVNKSIFGHKKSGFSVLIDDSDIEYSELNILCTDNEDKTSETLVSKTTENKVTSYMKNSQNTTGDSKDLSQQNIQESEDEGKPYNSDSHYTHSKSTQIEKSASYKKHLSLNSSKVLCWEDEMGPSVSTSTKFLHGKEKHTSAVEGSSQFEIANGESAEVSSAYTINLELLSSESDHLEIDDDDDDDVDFDDKAEEEAMAEEEEEVGEEEEEEDESDSSSDIEELSLSHEDEAIIKEVSVDPEEDSDEDVNVTIDLVDDAEYSAYPGSTPQKKEVSSTKNLISVEEIVEIQPLSDTKSQTECEVTNVSETVKEIALENSKDDKNNFTKGTTSGSSNTEVVETDIKSQSVKKVDINLKTKFENVGNKMDDQSKNTKTISSNRKKRIRSSSEPPEKDSFKKKRMSKLFKICSATELSNVEGVNQAYAISNMIEGENELNNSKDNKNNFTKDVSQFISDTQETCTDHNKYLSLGDGIHVSANKLSTSMTSVHIPNKIPDCRKSDETSANILENKIKDSVTKESLVEFEDAGRVTRSRMKSRNSATFQLEVQASPSLNDNSKAKHSSLTYKMDLIAEPQQTTGAVTLDRKTEHKSDINVKTHGVFILDTSSANLRRTRSSSISSVENLHHDNVSVTKEDDQSKIKSSEHVFMGNSKTKKSKKANSIAGCSVTPSDSLPRYNLRRSISRTSLDQFHSTESPINQGIKSVTPFNLQEVDQNNQIETYATERRLTRYQRMLLSKSISQTNSKKQIYQQNNDGSEINYNESSARSTSTNSTSSASMLLDQKYSLLSCKPSSRHSDEELSHISTEDECSSKASGIHHSPGSTQSDCLGKHSTYNLRKSRHSSPSVKSLSTVEGNCYKKSEMHSPSSAKSGSVVKKGSHHIIKSTHSPSSIKSLPITGGSLEIDCLYEKDCGKSLPSKYTRSHDNLLRHWSPEKEVQDAHNKNLTKGVSSTRSLRSDKRKCFSTSSAYLIEQTQLHPIAEEPSSSTSLSQSEKHSTKNDRSTSVRKKRLSSSESSLVKISQVKAEKKSENVSRGRRRKRRQ